MHTIVIGSYKGGTGKTTTAVNLSYNLARAGKRVLIIDADPQANATFMMANMSSCAKTINDLFRGAKISSCIRRTKFRGLPLDIVKGSSEIEESAGNAEAIKNGLAEIDTQYDYCIIDTHPSMQLPTIAAMIAADTLLVPFKPDGYGKNGLMILDDYINQIQATYNPSIHFYVFVTQYAGHKSQKSVLENMLQYYNFPFLETVITQREAVNTSIQMRRPLLMHRKKDVVTKDYIDLTEEVRNLVGDTMMGGMYNG